MLSKFLLCSVLNHVNFCCLLYFPALPFLEAAGERSQLPPDIAPLWNFLWFSAGGFWGNLSKPLALNGGASAQVVAVTSAQCLADKCCPQFLKNSGFSISFGRPRAASPEQPTAARRGGQSQQAAGASLDTHRKNAKSLRTRPVGRQPGQGQRSAVA